MRVIASSLLLGLADQSAQQGFPTECCGMVLPLPAGAMSAGQVRRSEDEEPFRRLLLCCFPVPGQPRSDSRSAAGRRSHLLAGSSAKRLPGANLVCWATSVLCLEAGAQGVGPFSVCRQADFNGGLVQDVWASRGLIGTNTSLAVLFYGNFLWPRTGLCLGPAGLCKRFMSSGVWTMAGAISRCNGAL